MHQMRDAHSKNSLQISNRVKYMLLIMFFTGFNIVVFMQFRSSSTYLQCSVETVIEAVSHYIDNNGTIPLASFVPQECSKVELNIETELYNSMSKVVKYCESGEKRGASLKSKEPSVTLFTTMPDYNDTDEEKKLVYNNTLQNWALLKPYVNPILFTSDIFWVTEAKNAGWSVMTPSDNYTIEKPPVLKYMYKLAMQKYDTLWYGFVNADILFTNDLVHNIESLNKKYEVNSTRIMLTGRRTNIDNLTQINPVSLESLQKNAKVLGTLYKEDAEDFFFVTKSFPWQNILPVVVGRPGFDNWLVGEARCRHSTTVIDVTDTLLAIHQTTTKGGNAEGHHHPGNDYNYKLFKQYQLKPNFMAGLTSCIIYRTQKTLCDSITVMQQTHFGPRCKCK